MLPQWFSHPPGIAPASLCSSSSVFISFFLPGWQGSGREQFTSDSQHLACVGWCVGFFLCVGWMSNGELIKFHLSHWSRRGYILRYQFVNTKQLPFMIWSEKFRAQWLFLYPVSHFLFLPFFLLSVRKSFVLIFFNSGSFWKNPCFLSRQALMKMTFTTGHGVRAGTTSISGLRWMPGAWLDSQGSSPKEGTHSGCKCAHGCVSWAHPICLAFRDWADTGKLQRNTQWGWIQGKDIAMWTGLTIHLFK